MERRREPVWKRPRGFRWLAVAFCTQIEIEKGGIEVKMKELTGIEEVLVAISASCGRAVIWLDVLD